MTDFDLEQTPKPLSPLNQALFFIPLVVLLVILFTISGTQKIIVTVEPELTFSVPGYWRTEYVTSDDLEAGNIVLTDLAEYFYNWQGLLDAFAQIRWIADSADSTSICVVSVWRYRPTSNSGVPTTVRGFIERVSASYSADEILFHDALEVNGLNVYRLDTQNVETSSSGSLTLRQIELGIQTRTQDYLFIIITDESYYQANSGEIEQMIQSIAQVVDE